MVAFFDKESDGRCLFIPFRPEALSAIRHFHTILTHAHRSHISKDKKKSCDHHQPWHEIHAYDKSRTNELKNP